MLDAARRRAIRRALRTWFTRHARDLPWRRTRDAYAIWVSEVMLQQTQVETVIPYFRRFLDAFPDIPALAAADEQQVLRLWEGLGYYRRARNLHRGARIIVASHGGDFPTCPDDARALPGLGRYTANAVLSQAFDARLPILETNSQRLLCRLLALRGEPGETATRKKLWQAAEELLPRRRVGDFNQALMELGALVCKPTPRCDSCPLRRYCRAFELNLQHALPARKTRPPIEQQHEVAVAVRRRKRWLFVQRAADGRWANLWGLPQMPLQPGQTAEAAARQLLDQLGLHAQLQTHVCTIRHGVTRFRVTIDCFAATCRSPRARSNPHRQWLTLDEVAAYPVSVPQRRLVALLQTLL